MAKGEGGSVGCAWHSPCSPEFLAALLAGPIGDTVRRFASRAYLALLLPGRVDDHRLAEPSAAGNDRLALCLMSGASCGCRLPHGIERLIHDVRQAICVISGHCLECFHVLLLVMQACLK